MVHFQGLESPLIRLQLEGHITFSVIEAAVIYLYVCEQILGFLESGLAEDGSMVQLSEKSRAGETVKITCPVMEMLQKATFLPIYKQKKHRRLL